MMDEIIDTIETVVGEAVLDVLDILGL